MTISSPEATTSLVPNRTASFVPSTEETPTDSGDGQQVHARRERVVALDELEVLGHHEDEPEQREERHRDRGAGGREARVAEQPDVEHRVPVRRSQAMKRASSDAREREAGERCGLPQP